METRKKPSMQGAIWATGGAISISVLALHLLERTLMSHFRLEDLLMPLGWIMMTVGAIMQWVDYFKKWVRFEIENHEERTETEK